MTPDRFYDWCKDNISGIDFLFVSSEAIEEHGKKINERLVSLKTIPGTCSHHRFVPTTDGFLMFRLSADRMSTIIPQEPSVQKVTTSELKPGQYTAVAYDDKWYIVCN